MGELGSQGRAQTVGPSPIHPGSSDWSGRESQGDFGGRGVNKAGAKSGFPTLGCSMERHRGCSHSFSLSPQPVGAPFPTNVEPIGWEVTA